MSATNLDPKHSKALEDCQSHAPGALSRPDRRVTPENITSADLPKLIALAAGDWTRLDELLERKNIQQLRDEGSEDPGADVSLNADRQLAFLLLQSLIRRAERVLPGGAPPSSGTPGDAAADWITQDPIVSNALEVLEQVAMDLRGAVDGRLSCSQAGQPAPEEAELAVLCDALEQLWILAVGSDA